MEDDDTDILRKAIREATQDFCPSTSDFFMGAESETANSFVNEYIPVFDFDLSSIVGQSAATASLGVDCPNDAADPPASDSGHVDGAIQSIDLVPSLPAVALQDAGLAFQADRADDLTIVSAQDSPLKTTVSERERLMVESISDSGVIYDAATNTKIVYHVIQPSKLIARCGLEGKSEAAQNASQPPGKAVGKVVCKPWGRRYVDAEVDERIVADPWSQEEKDQRKRQKSVTRYGRISKPPSYKVSNFKRIHHLDFDEEACESLDGGYTDYVVENQSDSGGEEGVENPTMATSNRNLQCQSCGKTYIKGGSLASHYRLNPTHESGVIPMTKNGAPGLLELSDKDLLIAKSYFGVTGPKAKTNDRATRARQYLSQYWQRGRRHTLRRRGRATRRPRLKEVMSYYSQEELLVDGMTELVKIAGTWDFLDTKCRQQQPMTDNYIANLYRELEVLTERTSEVSGICLEPCGSGGLKDPVPGHLDVKNETVAKLLGIPVGTYVIKEAVGRENSIEAAPPDSQLSPAIVDRLDVGSLDEEQIAPPLSPSSSSLSRCSVLSVATSTASSKLSSESAIGEDDSVPEAPETSEDGGRAYFGDFGFPDSSNWSPVGRSVSFDCARDDAVSPTLDYRMRLTNMSLVGEDESTSSTSATLPNPAAEEDCSMELGDGGEGDTSKRDPNAEYLSRLAECKAMETMAGDLSFVSIELPAGLLGDESQLQGDVPELTGEEEPDIHGELDGILGEMTASLSDDRLRFPSNGLSRTTSGRRSPGTGRDFDLLAMLENAEPPIQFDTVQTLVAVDSMEDN